MIQFIAFFFCFIVPCSVFASDNSCVGCHSQITQESTTHSAHSYLDWENSVHAKAGITCDICHGGDPSSKEIKKAHTNIFKSTDPASPIYFDKIPESCGSCHASELEGFKGSDHYKELTRSGKGPNCVTCHGSMASHVMTPKELEQTCTLCHRRPTQAYAALLSLQTTRRSLDQLKVQIEEAKLNKADVSAQNNALLEAEHSYREALKIWHTFNMRAALKEAQEINHNIRNASHELDLKKTQIKQK